MKSRITQSIKYYSFLIVILFLLPVLQINIQNSLEYSESEDSLSSCFEADQFPEGFGEVVTQTEPGSLIAKAQPSNSINTLSHPRSRFSRAPDQENEPNDDIVTSVSSSNKLLDSMDMEGQLTYETDEKDFFYIDILGGGLSSIDRVNITPTFSNKSYIDTKAVGILLKIYTVYDDKLYLLDYKVLGTNWAVINDGSIPWKNDTSVLFNADRTGRYFLNVSSFYIIDAETSLVIDQDVKINYTLSVAISKISNADNNNDPNNGTSLAGPVGNLTINQADDHWDWYKIDSLTENRAVNVSLSVKTTTAYKTGYFETRIHYVKVIGVLKCFDLETSTEKSFIGYSDLEKSYNPNPMPLYLAATFSTAYLGIHIQQIVFENMYEAEAIDCGESNIKYNIDSFGMNVVNIAPTLSEWNVTPKKGNLQDSYKFDILYTDADNDPPFFVNVTLAGQNHTLDKSTDPSNDDDYTNGELYEFTISGTSFNGIPHSNYNELDFDFNTRDYFAELSMPLASFLLQTFTYIRVIDNQRPTVRDGLPEMWTIMEDSEPVYIDLFEIFSDPENTKYPGEEVTFEVWSEIYDWSYITGPEILGPQFVIATIMDNDTLKLEPELNKYGYDTVKIRAYDVEYVIEGITATIEYNLTINITPVNDKPILKQPIDYIDGNAMHEDQIVNITFEAKDSTDKHNDPVIYSINILDEIPLLGADPEKYEYQFSNTTGNISFLPDNALVGEYLINVSATDNGTIEPIGLYDEKQFKLLILNENDPPIANITYPQNNATFNTSTNLTLSALNSTDDDIIHGDRITYYWYLDSETNLLTKIGHPEVILNPIKTSGKHTLILKVMDINETVDYTNISIWVISLVGDIPGGEDTDDDGIPDLWELRYESMDLHFNDAQLDFDNDNFTNVEEYLGIDGVPGGGDSSDPMNPLSYPGDRDADELPDDWEIVMFGNLRQGKDDDPDNDKFSNYQEYLGVDGLPGNDDWSNPLDTKETPKSTKAKKSEKKETDMETILLIGIVIVVIIILLLVLFLTMRKRKKRAEEEEKKESTEKKPIYTPEPMPVLPVIPQMPFMPPGAPGGTMPIAQPLRMPVKGPIPHQGPQGQQTQQTPQSQHLGLPPTGQVVESEVKKEQK